MTAEDDALKSLRDSKLLDVLTWGAPVAFAATDQIYDEDAGHDQIVVGVLNFKHFSDLIDRATANGRFNVAEGRDGLGDDMLTRGIAPSAAKSMPLLAPVAIDRHDYKQSPGWVAGGYRVLLQSYPYGKVDDIVWSQRSDAKRQVASQLYVDAEALFADEDFGIESATGIPNDDGFDGITLIAAHAFNPLTKQYDLYIGQSKNAAHADDSCWHWKVRILSGGAPAQGATISDAPVPPGEAASTNVDDVPVRLKKPLTGTQSDSANG